MNRLSSRPAPPIRFIEFMGLPGSGKSTIAACLESDLRQRGIKTVSRSLELADHAPFLWRQCRRFLRVVRNAGRCRHLYLDAFKLIATSGQKSSLDLAKVTWNFWSVVALMADCRASRDSVIIIDQGLFQAIWSIQLSASKALSVDICNGLLRSAGVTDILVVNIQPDIPLASNRLLARAFKGTRLNSQLQDTPAGSWQMAAENIATLMDLAQTVLPRDRFGDRVITIENDTTCPKAAAAEIASVFLSRTCPQERPEVIDLGGNV